MKVSYVITLYNKSEYIGNTLRSILRQEDVLDFGESSGRFMREIIIVDDESSDDSYEVVCAIKDEHYAHSIPDERCDIVILQQKNGGPSVALNTAISCATGDWIYFCDGDDALEKNATYSLLKVAHQYNAQFVSGYHYNNDSYNKAEFDGSVLIYDDPIKKALEFHTISPSATIVWGEVVRAGRGCDERVFIQDYSIVLRLSAYVNKFARLKQVVALNTCHDVGGTRLSENKHQESYDTALARSLYIAEKIDLSYSHLLVGLKRQLAKTSSYFRKNNHESTIKLMRWVISKHNIRNLALKCGYQPSATNARKWMAESISVFDKAIDKKIVRLQTVRVQPIDN